MDRDSLYSDLKHQISFGSRTTPPQKVGLGPARNVRTKVGNEPWSVLSGSNYAGVNTPLTMTEYWTKTKPGLILKDKEVK